MQILRIERSVLPLSKRYGELSTHQSKGRAIYHENAGRKIPDCLSSWKKTHFSPGFYRFLSTTVPVREIPRSIIVDALMYPSLGDRFPRDSASYREIKGGWSHPAERKTLLITTLQRRFLPFLARKGRGLVCFARRA